MAKWGLIDNATARAPLDELTRLIADQAAQEQLRFKRDGELQTRNINERKQGLDESKFGLDQTKFTTEQTAKQKEDADFAAVVQSAPDWMKPVLNFRRVAGLTVSPKDAAMSPEAQHAEGLQDAATIADRNAGIKASDRATANADQAERDKRLFGYDLQKIDETARVKPTKPEALTPNEAIRQTRQLRNDYVKETSAARTMSQQLGLMKQGLAAAKSGNMAAGSQAVLVTFQKILDPTSVVRESEYARSSSGLSLLSRMEGAAQKLSQGGAGVTPDELQHFSDLAEKFVENQTRYANQTKQQLDQIADAYGLQKELITNDIDPDEPAPVKPGMMETMRTKIGNLFGGATPAVSHGVPSKVLTPAEYIAKYGHK